MNNSLLSQISPLPTIDDIFHYKIGRNRQIDDRCRIRIYRGKRTAICILTELKDSGMSVTNSVEKIIPQLFQLFQDEGNPLPENTIFIEHYDEDSYERDNREEDFSLVRLDESYRPSWSPLSTNQVLDLIENLSTNIQQKIDES